MKHKGLAIGVSLGLGAAVFLVVWLFTLWARWGWLIAITCGVLACAASLGYVLRTYWRCTLELNRLTHHSKRAGEKVLYADVAGLIEGYIEYTGALVVTTNRFWFRTPPDWKRRVRELDLAFSDISMVKNHRDYFMMAAAGRENRFKVFECDRLVEIIQAGVDVEMQLQLDQRKMAREMLETERALKDFAAEAPAGNKPPAALPESILPVVPAAQPTARPTLPRRHTDESPTLISIRAPKPGAAPPNGPDAAPPAS